MGDDQRQRGHHVIARAIPVEPAISTLTIVPRGGFVPIGPAENDLIVFVSSCRFVPQLRLHRDDKPPLATAGSATLGGGCLLAWQGVMDDRQLVDAIAIVAWHEENDAMKGLV